MAGLAPAMDVFALTASRKTAPPASFREPAVQSNSEDLRLVDTGSNAEALDLVFHQQLATLQLRNLEAVGRRMVHRFGDFVLERAVPSFKFRKMRLHRHVGWLLKPLDNTPDSANVPSGPWQVDYRRLCIAVNPHFRKIAHVSLS
jgi:hypothetical protein